MISGDKEIKKIGTYKKDKKGNFLVLNALKSELVRLAVLQFSTCLVFFSTFK